MRFALILAALAVATGVRAADTPAGSTDPKGVPLKLEIAGTAKYTLDLGGKTAAEFKKAIADAKESGGPVPPPPAVDLRLTVTNTSKKPIEVWKSGDPIVVSLTLKGPGVLEAKPALAFTADFKLPMATELEPGKSLEFPLKALVGGFRGASDYTYWIEPGEYELVASWKSGVSPKPEEAMEQDGFGIVTVTSAPFKIVVGKK